MGRHRGWAPYVPVAERRARGERKANKLLKKGQSLSPIKIPGRKIATTFWGKGWCDHLERYSDFSNRLPRGRTYARNGSIVDLRITTGKITAMVCGSDLYRIQIGINTLSKQNWKQITSDCAQSIHSVMDLMRGKLGSDVIGRLCDPKTGMFPQSREIKLACSCPDGARLCKHLAAVLYGVGHRLDEDPALLFALRNVDQSDLVSESLSSIDARDAMGLNQQSSLASEDLSGIFGIDLALPSEAEQPEVPKAPKRTKAKKVKKKKAASSVIKAGKLKTKEKAKATTKTKPKASPTTVVKRKAVRKKKAASPRIALSVATTTSTAPKKKVVKKKAVKKKAVKKKLALGR